MVTYCHIANGVVVNRALFEGEMPADWPDRETWIADDVAQIGWLYDGEGVFIAPEPEPDEPTPVLIPYGIFRARWQPEELEALFEQRKLHWQVDDFISLATAQDHINLSRSTAAQAKVLFVSLGVLTEGRADVIFAS